MKRQAFMQRTARHNTASHTVAQHSTAQHSTHIDRNPTETDMVILMIPMHRLFVLFSVSLPGIGLHVARRHSTRPGQAFRRWVVLPLLLFHSGRVPSPARLPTRAQWLRRGVRAGGGDCGMV